MFLEGYGWAVLAFGPFLLFSFMLFIGEEDSWFLASFCVGSLAVVIGGMIALFDSLPDWDDYLYTQEAKTEMVYGVTNYTTTELEGGGLIFLHVSTSQENYYTYWTDIGNGRGKKFYSGELGIIESITETPRIVFYEKVYQKSKFVMWYSKNKSDIMTVRNNVAEMYVPTGTIFYEFDVQ